MSRFAIPGEAFLLSHKFSAKETAKIADKLAIIPSDDIDIVDPEEARVASVQLMLRQYHDFPAYVQDMNSYVADAVNRRAKLICFPMFAGLSVLSLFPKYDSFLAAFSPSAANPHFDFPLLAEFLDAFSDCFFAAFTNTMSLLAQRYRITIMAGTLLYFEDGQPFHRAILFNNSGELCGFQDKITLSPLEKNLGIIPARELKVFDTPAGAISILTGSDADHFEIARVARNIGAQILLNPNAFSAERSLPTAALGLPMRIQENDLCGVISLPVGDTGLGFVAEGHSELIFPSMAGGRRVCSSARFEPDIVCDSLPVGRLDLLQNPYSSDRNPLFLENYLDKLIPCDPAICSQNA